MTTTPVSAAAAAAGESLLRMDGPDGPVTINVGEVEEAIAAGLRPVVEGSRVSSAEIAGLAARLVGHVEVLLPVAEIRYRAHRPGGGPYHGLFGADLDALRRRLGYERPDARSYPLNAMVWVAEIARSCRALLALVTAPGTGSR